MNIYIPDQVEAKAAIKDKQPGSVKPAQDQKPPEAPKDNVKRPQDKKPDLEKGKQPDKTKSPFKPWEEILKDTKKIEGFFTFHMKKDRTLYLELQTDQLNRDFALIAHINKGVGDFGLFEGMPLTDTQLLRFKRVGNSIFLYRMNPLFRAEKGSPMAKSLEENVGNSIVHTFKIESEHEESHNLLVNATKLFLSQYLTGETKVDPSRSFISKVQGFPKNVEIDADLTINSPKAKDSPAVSDPRFIPLGIRYSLFALPDNLMMPRFADDRVGYFLTAIKDFSLDKEDTNYVAYIDRWRLEKRDNSAEMSEPVKPIVYYIDRSVPYEYRQYVKEGIEAWNKAFEKAGFKNAIVVREAPEDDPTWRAEDVRYSTVRWAASHRMGFAIGPSQTDPRTGEILNADILISSIFVRSFLREHKIFINSSISPADIDKMSLVELLDFGNSKVPEPILKPNCSLQTCTYQSDLAGELAFGYITLLCQGVIEEDGELPREFLGDALRELVMHEVGHTLGLRHNFRASASIPYEKLHDKTFTSENGVTASVMDYVGANISPDTDKQGDYWNKEVGAYDVWAIRYGYSPVYRQKESDNFKMSGKPVNDPEDELVGLAKIAALSTNPLYVYGTDEDRIALDPLINLWDHGSDPVAYARDQAELIRSIIPKLEEKLIGEGEGYQKLRLAFLISLGTTFRNMATATNMVAGVYTSRDHKGGQDAQAPFNPLPAEKQREAIETIIKYTLAEDAFKFDPDLLRKLAPEGLRHWGTKSDRRMDSIHLKVMHGQMILLMILLHPEKIQRMLDLEQMLPEGSRPYTVAEHFGRLTDAIWKEAFDANTRSVSSIRRNLQRLHAMILSTLVMSSTPLQDQRTISRYELKRISAALARAKNADNIDTITRAHFDELATHIRKVLESSIMLTK